MAPTAGHVAAFLQAGGFAAAAVGANEVAVIADQLDEAKAFIAERMDSEHDELGITDSAGNHIALLPTAELPTTRGD